MSNTVINTIARSVIAGVDGFVIYAYDSDGDLLAYTGTDCYTDSKFVYARILSVFIESNSTCVAPLDSTEKICIAKDTYELVHDVKMNTDREGMFSKGIPFSTYAGMAKSGTAYLDKAYK